MSIYLFHSLQTLSASCEAATAATKALGDVIQAQYPTWLIIEGGNWPDRFSLLNRYLRTGVEPEYFSDERWTADGKG